MTDTVLLERDGQIATVTLNRPGQRNAINHEMWARLSALGYRFVSDTDTEVLAHLVHHYFKSNGDLLLATHRAVGELTGAYAIAIVSQKDPDRMVVARKGAPLLLGLGEGENFCASDASALLQVTRRIVYLEEGDVVEVMAPGELDRAFATMADKKASALVVLPGPFTVRHRARVLDLAAKTRLPAIYGFGEFPRADISLR